jgi:hypothetical protein
MLHFVVHLPVIGLLACFCFLAILNSESENMAEQGSEECHVESFGQMPRTGKAGSYGRFVFKFFGNHPAFSSCHTNSVVESPFPTSSPASVAGYFVDLISLIVRTNGHSLEAFINYCYFFSRKHSVEVPSPLLKGSFLYYSSRF